MKHYILFLLTLLLCSGSYAAAEQTGRHQHGIENSKSHGEGSDCGSGPAWCKKEGATCSPEMHGRCGKRRGDWYGASQPVANAATAHAYLLNYFSGQGYTVSDVTENKWGYRAEVIDQSGTIIDRVMIDKRSGRIRSIN